MRAASPTPRGKEAGVKSLPLPGLGEEALDDLEGLDALEDGLRLVLIQNILADREWTDKRSGGKETES